MLETLKSMSKLCTAETEKMTLEQLSDVYRDSLSPIYLAAAFKKLYGRISEIGRKFPTVLEEDKASFALERLDFCMQTLNDKFKLNTYFSKCLFNEFRDYAQRLDCHNRKANYCKDSYDELLESGFDIPVFENGLEMLVENEKDLTVIQFLESQDLTDLEIMYCELILDNFATNKEMAEKLKVSVMTITNLKKRVKEKLFPQKFALQTL